MIRTVIVAAGFIGLPLITAAPALADEGPISTIACSNPCNIVERTIDGYRAFPGDTVTNYGLAVGDTIQNYTGSCTADQGGENAGNELRCTPANYAAFPGDTLAGYAAFPGQTLAGYAAFPGQTLTNYANFASDTAQGYLGGPDDPPAGDDADAGDTG